jgi:hypothetical protein
MQLVPRYNTAMAVIGGGLLTDYDVFNVDVPPSPNCDFLPNNGAFTTHDKHVPSATTGDADAFSGFLDDMATTDWRG